MRTLILMLLSSFAASAVAAPTYHITSADWLLPRHGERLVAQPALRGAVQALAKRPEGVLELRYPGGDEGLLWAEELRSWLTALGVASSRIELVPGGAPELVELVVTDALARRP